MKFIKKHWLVEQMPVFESIPASRHNKARSTFCNVIVVAYKASSILLNLLKALYVRVSVRIPWRGCIFKRWSHQRHIRSLFNLCTAWFSDLLIIWPRDLFAFAAILEQWAPHGSRIKFCLAHVDIPSALFGKWLSFPLGKLIRKVVPFKIRP